MVHVALGPSLGSWRETLQLRLGTGWMVEDLISDDLTSDDLGLTSDDVVVLGTTEIAPGEIQVRHHGTTTSVLIGSWPASSPSPLDRLVALLRS